MIEYKEVKEEMIYKTPKTITCDCCGKKKNLYEENFDLYEENFDKYEAYNFVSFQKTFGYGSEIGDDERISIDICERCFIEKFGIEFIHERIVK